MPELPAEAVDLSLAAGRVLRQVVVAERDQPPFDRVMMDGIAIAHADFVSGQRQFTIQCTQMAGDTAAELMPGHCVEIMTGASLPVSADCIIPVERISVNDGVATLEEGYDAKAQQFIHPRASDHAAGSDLLTRPRSRTSSRSSTTPTATVRTSVATTAAAWWSRRTTPSGTAPGSGPPRRLWRSRTPTP